MTVKRPAGPPDVVLVGRPNVGKSTLFNRITGSRRAIVTAVPGTTRDTLEQPADWLGTSFSLIDTGGMFGASQDRLLEQVVAHGRRAMEAADLIIFVVDGQSGLVPGDEEIARAVRLRGVPVILAVNKMDDKRAAGRTLEFYGLGFEPLIELSAEHGQGVGDLLDAVVKRLPSRGVRPSRPSPDDDPDDARPADPPELGVAIIGRPNVGKSSLVNRLLREERVVVNELPGTTRDAIDALLRWHKRDFRIVDTAGIRRAGHVGRGGQVEQVSVMVARRTIARSDVAVLLIDATEGATDQDAAIAGEADAAGCGIIVAVNKWDLVKGQGADFGKRFDEELQRRLKFLDYAPLIHVSAATGERLPRLLETIDRVGEARRRRVPTAELNRFVEAVTAVHPPASPGRREVRILFAAQTAIAPPTFVFFTNVATRFHFSYERYLINRLREAFGFLGTPIRMQVRRRQKKEAG